MYTRMNKYVCVSLYICISADIHNICMYIMLYIHLFIMVCLHLGFGFAVIWRRSCEDWDAE